MHRLLAAGSGAAGEGHALQHHGEPETQNAEGDDGLHQREALAEFGPAEFDPTVLDFS